MGWVLWLARNQTRLEANSFTITNYLWFAASVITLTSVAGDERP